MLTFRTTARTLITAACVAFALVGLPQQRPSAQMSMNIAAVVNDDVISVYDLSQRISLVIAFSNLQDTVQVRQRVALDVLRRLITEKLRMQEAKRLKIEIPQEKVDESISDLERNNKMPVGGLVQLLKARGIDKETLEQQLRADLTWIQTVTAMFRSIVTVSDQEIEDEIQKIQASAGKNEYLLSEIFLSYDGKTEAEVKEEANRLTEQLKSGASWQGMAQAFSRSASADEAGNIGWNHASELNKEIAAALVNMQPGQVSPPIQTDDGIYLILLRDVRVSQGIAAAHAGAEHVTLHQLHIPVPPGADAQTVAQLTTRAQQLAHGAKDCPAFDAVAKSDGGPLSGALGTFDVNSLSPQIKTLINNVPANGVSQPMRTDNGVVIMMVCERQSEAGEDPMQKARDDIRLRLLNEQLNRLATQHEQKLRQQSFIDVRL